MTHFGLSAAGDISLACASFLGSRIKAVMVLNACVSSVMYPTVYKDKRVEGIKFDMDAEKMKIMDSGVVDIIGLGRDPLKYPETVRKQLS